MTNSPKHCTTSDGVERRMLYTCGFPQSQPSPNTHSANCNGSSLPNAFPMQCSHESVHANQHGLGYPHCVFFLLLHQYARCETTSCPCQDSGWRRARTYDASQLVDDDNDILIIGKPHIASHAQRSQPKLKKKKKGRKKAEFSMQSQKYCKCK